MLADMGASIVVRFGVPLRWFDLASGVIAVVALVIGLAYLAACFPALDRRTLWKRFLVPHYKGRDPFRSCRESRGLVIPRVLSSVTLLVSAVVGLRSHL